MLPPTKNSKLKFESEDDTATIAPLTDDEDSLTEVDSNQDNYSISTGIGDNPFTNANKPHLTPVEKEDTNEDNKLSGEIPVYLSTKQSNSAIESHADV